MHTKINKYFQFPFQTRDVYTIPFYGMCVNGYCVFVITNVTCEMWELRTMRVYTLHAKKVVDKTGHTNF